MEVRNRSDIFSALAERILVLDGAMGTMIQRLGLTEDDCHGVGLPPADTGSGKCHDVLVLTRPDVIAAIHRQYIRAGADIITTNTFNANRVSLSDYGIGNKVVEINRAAARLARTEADAEFECSGRKIRVAGSCGPASRIASLSADVANDSCRYISFSHLSDAYAEQVEALAEGGVDLILFETVFDILNLKAALDGADRVFKTPGVRLPVMISATISGEEGILPSGQTLDELVETIGRRDDLLSIGLNCSFGPKHIIPHIRHLASISPYPVSCYPNAGLPDADGNYPETPESFVNAMLPELRAGNISIIGGCCGTTPDHIRRLADACAKCDVSRQ